MRKVITAAWKRNVSFHLNNKSQENLLESKILSNCSEKKGSELNYHYKERPKIISNENEISQKYNPSEKEYKKIKNN